jgi:DNA-binding NarL/FixJ family response regulator
MTQVIRVLIVDDHPVIRAGLSNILGAETDINVVGEAKDGLEAVTKALELKPDVILMDIFMPHCTGPEAMITIEESLPKARVLILTVSDREEDLLQALRFGAKGYLLKSASTTEVVEAVRRTAAGEAMLSSYMTARLVAEFRDKGGEPPLSSRETEVLRLLGEGLTNTEMANRLFLSESTIRTYLGRLLDKLHLKNRAEAIAYACNHRGTKHALVS